MRLQILGQKPMKSQRYPMRKKRSKTRAIHNIRKIASSLPNLCLLNQLSTSLVVTILNQHLIQSLSTQQTLCLRLPKMLCSLERKLVRTNKSLKKRKLRKRFSRGHQNSAKIWTQLLLQFLRIKTRFKNLRKLAIKDFKRF